MNGPERKQSALAVLTLAVLLSACGNGGTSPPRFVCPERTTGVTVYKPELCDSGYTLLSSLGIHEEPAGSGRYHGAILVDMDGSLVHEWKIAGIPAKMLPDGHVLGFRWLRDDGTIHQEMDFLVELDWSGKEIWRWGPRAVDERGRWISRGHHDFHRQGFAEGAYVPGATPSPASGRTLILVHENVDRPDIAPWTLEDDAIVEVDRDGNVLWEWLASDHFDEFGFDEAARQAIRTFQVFIPPDPQGRDPGVTDWIHINTIAYLGPNKWWSGGDARFHPENIIVSSRQTNIIWIIDKATGAIVWRVGPDYGPGSPGERLGQIIGQHHAHVIPEGFPGEGNILVFDNGGAAGFGRSAGPLGIPVFPNKVRTFSRVIEFDPVSLEVVWEYKRPLPAWGETRIFWSVYISGAQRLANGNTLITEGDTGRIFEVTLSTELVWEYLSPYHDYFYDHFPSEYMKCERDVYRAYRIPYDYIPAGLLR